MSRHFEAGFAGFSVQRQNSDYGIPAAAHAHHAHEEDPLAADQEEENPEQGIRIDLEQTRYDLALHLHEPLPLLDELRLFGAYTDYQHSEVEPSGEVGTTYSNESRQLRLEAVHKTVGIWHGVFGLQFGQSEFSALGEEAFIPITDKDQLGLFLVEDLHFDAGLLELGVRYDRDELDPQSGANSRVFNNLSFSASWVQNLEHGWQWSAAYSHAERAPAIEELYSNAGVLNEVDWVVHAATEAIELGASDLDSETSNNVDLSLSRSWGDNYLEVVLYHNRFSDYIGLLNTGLEVDTVSVYQYTQVDATFSGLELSSVLGLGEFGGGDLELSINGDISRGKLDASQGYVPRMPANRLLAQLDWRAGELYTWARVVRAFEQDRAAFNEEATEAYTRVDLGLEWSLSQASDWTVFASVHNLTDEEIRLHTSFLKEIAPEPGRGFEIGVRGQF
ncbi:TonB-dependent receptor domain-containing protein [Aequoribacter sp.]|uniref:TonB-dependent receptor domain-containing protein n=1 Tax=Aequoribacter sp. TaxID=2847771 RepID=UPI003F69D48A